MIRGSGQESITRTLDYSKYVTKVASRRKPSLIRKFADMYVKNPTPTSIFLAGGMPNSQTYPFKEISVTYADGVQRKLSPKEVDNALQYGSSKGHPPLVKKWKEFQQTHHAPPRDDWDVLFTTGSQEGCSKLFELLLSEGDPVMIQTPLFAATIASILPLALDFIEIQQDADGVIPERIEEALEERIRNKRPMPKVLYVNPIGANPTGTVLPTRRKERIIELAQKYDFLVIEDDPYYFLNFLEERPKSFLSLDTEGRVFRIDSFSKIMSAGIRLGVVTAHRDVIEILSLHVECSTLHTSNLSQVLVHHFLETWGPEKIEQHFRELQLFYKQRRDVVIAMLDKHFTGIAEWTVPKAGMFVWMKVTGIDNTMNFVMDRCIPNEIFILPGNAFNVDRNKPSQYLRLSYSSATPDSIDKAVTVLAKLIREEVGKKSL